MTAVDLAGKSAAELEEERNFLLASLEDLEAERDAGDVDEHDYTVLRDQYTARAAAVLRALDQQVLRGAGASVGPRLGGDGGPGVSGPGGGGGPGASSGVGGVRGRPSGAAGRSRWARGTVAIVAAFAIFAALAGTLVMHTAGQRLPGDNVSGSTPTSPVAKLLAQAQTQFQSQHLLDAVRTYDQVIALDPRNPEALAYKGWLLRLAGHQGNDQLLVDRGLTSIQAAEAAQPAYPDAHFFAGETLLRDKNDAAGAIKEFEQFLADNPPPDYAPLVQGELTAARAMLPGATTSTTVR